MATRLEECYSVSNSNVRLRRKFLVLPVIAMFLFGIGSYGSYRFNQHTNIDKYYWWSSIRLDRDPLDRHPDVSRGGKSAHVDGIEWEPTSIWVDPGGLAIFLMTSAFPAFILGEVLAHAVGRLGVSEFTTFIISVPILMFAWYYFLSWLGFRIFVRLRKRQKA
jgi:hypothetical protein